MLDATAGSPLDIVVEHDAWCDRSGASRVGACQVVVQGKEISLGFASLRHCPGNPAASCANAVQTSVCKLPPLAAGVYNLTYRFEQRDKISVALTVRDGGPRLACTSGPSVTLDFQGLSTACVTAEDCELVGGDLCSNASCDRRAIAKTAVSEYEARAVDHYARCLRRPSGGAAECAPPTKALCESGRCVAR
jgi:hypothetical protein